MIDSGKHSSLLRYGIIYGRKNFYWRGNGKFDIYWLSTIISNFQPQGKFWSKFNNLFYTCNIRHGIVIWAACWKMHDGPCKMGRARWAVHGGAGHGGPCMAGPGMVGRFFLPKVASKKIAYICLCVCSSFVVLIAFCSILNKFFPCFLVEKS